MISRFDNTSHALAWLRRQEERLRMTSAPDDFSLFPQTGVSIQDSADPDSKWVVGNNGLGRPDGRFYTIGNVRTEVPSGREVTFWFSPMVMGEVEGLIILIVDVNGDVLIRAKSEPGNVGVVLDDGSPTRLLFSPPFQASQSNMAAHGNRVPLVDLARSVRIWEDGPEDGRRFYEKVNKYGLLTADAEVVASQVEISPNPEDFIWVTRGSLCELRRQGMVNGLLRSAMALLA